MESSQPSTTQPSQDEFVEHVDNQQSPLAEENDDNEGHHTPNNDGHNPIPTSFELLPNPHDSTAAVEGTPSFPSLSPTADEVEASAARSSHSPRMSLLELGEETMAQAMLIFLLADLRILSATGRIRTKFEDLSLDNDTSPRVSSQDYAGIRNVMHNDPATLSSRGVTAAHIMAVLLVEILREAEDVRAAAEQKRSSSKKKKKKQPIPTSSLLAPNHETTRQNAAKVFRRDVRAANGMPSLLHCYNEMLSEDIRSHTSQISREMYPLDEDLQPPNLGGAEIHTTATASVTSDPVVVDTTAIHPPPTHTIPATTTTTIADPEAPSTFHPRQPSPTTDQSMEFHQSNTTTDLEFKDNPTSHITPMTPLTPRESIGFSIASTDSHQFSSSLHVPNIHRPPATPTPHTLHRRESSTFQKAHFNPNVEMQDDDDSDSGMGILGLPQRVGGGGGMGMSMGMGMGNNHNSSHSGTTSATNRQATNRQATNRQAGMNRPAAIAKIRERVEKAIPERMAQRVTQMTQILPTSPAMRQQREMEHMADIQNQLLKGMTDHPSNSASLTKARIGSSSHASKRPMTTANTLPRQNIPLHHDGESIRKLIEQAVDKRDAWRLGFIKSFFREGTVSHILANSSSEMVWLSDWHTQHECTYAISMDREKGKVLLAFRGAYTESDWKHIVDWYDTATSNPVKEDYPNRPTNIRLHSGFHKYLFRVRKDTQTTKYDEIAAKLAHYCELTGYGARITITGHSLGAALATIFSLYASTEERFTAHGAMECVTFGAPCIGNWRFAGAVKHQEDAGKLRIAKFHVKGDSVPHLPPSLFRHSSHGAQYWNSGIDVALPYIRKGRFFQRVLGQPKPKVSYHDPDSETYFGSLVRQVRDYYVWNLPIRFWRFALFHTLVEHKKRMTLVDKSDPDSLLAQCSLKELYDRRHDLTKRAMREQSRRRKPRSSIN